MQRPPPHDIGPIYIGDQPKPIDAVHIKRPPQDYSLSPHDRALSIVRQPYLAQRYDSAKYFNAVLKLDLVTTAEKLKPIIEEEYRVTIQSLPRALDHEVSNITKNHHTASSPHSIESKKHEKYIVDLLTLGKDAERKSVINQANAFYGSDPLARSMHDLLASIERVPKQRPSHVFQAWSTSYAAAYSALVLSESIRLLTEKSNQLSTTIAVLESQQAAARQAEIAARAAAEQRAAQAQAAQETAIIKREKAQAEAEHAAKIAAQIAQAELEAREDALQEARKKEARQRKAAQQADRRRKQVEASIVAAEFDSKLRQLSQNRPEGIDEKLRWTKDRYQALHAAYLTVSKAEREVGGYYKTPGSEKRWSALNNAKEEIKALTRQKHKIDKVQIPLIDGTSAAVRPLVITADGLISGYEGSPFSLAEALGSLNDLRTTLTSGPIGVFLASIFYTPTLGNGELQRNPLVVTIPLSQFYPEREYSPSGTPALLYWLRHRVVASARGEHTRLYLESPKSRFGVRVRQASFDPQTKRYTFTTEGLIPITLSWTPDSPPGDELLNSTDLPATDSGIRIYPGARVTQIEGRVDEHPSCDFDDPDDYILEFPIESGIEPIYIMATRGGPHYEPGTATGEGQVVGENWLGNATQPGGSPVPAQIADQLRGQEFRSFDRFRESFWKAVAADELLRRQFGKVDLEQMANGAAPYAEPWDTVGSREKIEIHHKHRIADGGEVYGLENLRILTPKAHIELHKEGTPQ
ncbi:S-type pyocin domain-containing protein [Pseudomonas sp. UV AK001]|uniref:S-type pyocin domain-containing protein n=1 Tax=Pseudomonas sp. UV AK001 TaxID=3384791 RepID=UPI0038D486F2